MRRERERWDGVESGEGWDGEGGVEERGRMWI